MAWNDADELIVAGSGQAYIGSVGTDEPADAEATLDTDLVGLGYHTEEGVSTNKTLDIVEHRAWQSRKPIRRDKESEDFQIGFELMQWEEDSVILAFGGGSIDEVSTGQYKYTPPSVEDALAEWMLVVDVIDGDTRGRFVIPRGTVTEGVESVFRANQPAVLPITFRALENDAGDDWYFLTNSAAFAGGS